LTNNDEALVASGAYSIQFQTNILQDFMYLSYVWGAIVHSVAFLLGMQAASIQKRPFSGIRIERNKRDKKSKIQNFL